MSEVLNKEDAVINIPPVSELSEMLGSEAAYLGYAITDLAEKRTQRNHNYC